MNKVVIIIISLFLVFPIYAQAKTLNNSYPHLANYFLKWTISDEEAKELSKWDLLILDMDVQNNSRVQLEEIRKLNPNIIILAYLTSQEMIKNVNSYDNLSLRQDLASHIIDSWWLRDAQGNKISNWSGTNMINLSTAVPSDSLHKHYIDYLPEFVNDKLKSSGLWDGVFYDNTWGDISWLNGGNIDINNNGAANNKRDLDKIWSDSFRQMLEKSRKILGPDFIIVGNGRVYDPYQNILNGMMLESFPASWENGGTWTGSMKTYLKLPLFNTYPQVSIINVFSKDKNNYKAFRFGLVSAMLGNGYYSYDYDISDHGQTWWYDEYNVNFGPAESQAYNLLDKNNKEIKPGLWRRDFKHAIVILNSTNKDRGYIFSKERIKRLSGSQDYKTNNGKKVDFLRLSPNDGVVLLKDNSEIVNKSFSNGYFYRVFNNKGKQLQDGFFSYYNNFPGGQEIITTHGTKSEKEAISLVSNHGQIELYKNSKKIVDFNPYNNLFHGDLSLDVETIDGYINRVVVSPKNSGGPQVLVFTLDGKIRSNFFAYNKKLRTGLHVAFGDVDNDGHYEIVTGPGRGEKPLIKVFTLDGKLKSSFLAYDKNFKGGVDVAVADVTGDNQQDIITAPGRGGGPNVRVFNYLGRPKLGFFAYDKNFRGGIEVSTSDLNGDGKSDILVGIKNFY